MDSFLKESMRTNGLGSSKSPRIIYTANSLPDFFIVGFPRKAMEALKLSDGTVIPAGSLLSPSFGAHFDPEYYPDPMKFDPTRFMEGTCADSVDTGGLVHTSNHFLPFGHGKHAW